MELLTALLALDPKARPSVKEVNDFLLGPFEVKKLEQMLLDLFLVQRHFKQS